MENSELNQLIELLDEPSALKQKLEFLKASTNLSEETEGFIIVYNSFNGDCEKIKNYLKDSKTKTVTPLKNKNRFSTYLKYAAVFALLLATGTYLYNRQDKVKALSHQFEEPGLINYMSTTTTSNWEDIMFDFKTKNYLKADKQIKKALIENPKNDTLIYFSGVVKFKLNHLKAAKTQFQKLHNSKSTNYNDKSIYYLGLIEYKRRHFKASNTLFKSLSNSIDLDVKNASFEHVNEIQPKLK